jgi:hypothetical protein
VIAAAVSAGLRWCLGGLLAIGLGGCVGLVRSHLDWVAVGSGDTTKAEVLTRFGEPRRRAREAGRDVWYYHLLDAGPSGQRPATEGATIVYAFVVPVWWRTLPDDNTRFRFDGDTVADASELRVAEWGFFCGVNLVERWLFSCGPTP